MNRSMILIFLLVLATVALPVAFSARRVSAAAQQVSDAQQILLRTVTEGREVLQLRADRQRIAASEQPQNDVVARITETLTAAGLPRQFRTLTPDPATPLNPGGGGLEYVRQSFSLALMPMTIEQFGGFLEEWRQRQSMWTVTRIELNHGSGPAASGPDRYEVTIVISAVYVAD